MFGLKLREEFIKRMNTHFEIRSVRKMAGNALAAIFVLCLVVLATSAQAPPNPAPPPENIPAGALIIPMDNIHQGNGAGTTFNLRAYGLANVLLQNNIPVKWAIKPGKAKDDVDFSANVSRISGSQGVNGPANVAFSGGPFIIPAEYDTPTLRGYINTFNNSGTDVVVYKTNAATMADIRYTLTHKPKIAIGPDGGGLGNGIHQKTFTAAGITQTVAVNDDIIKPDSCYTLATQAHSESSAFVNLYRQFVMTGGNLFLQCAAIETFENNPSGHFQTTGAGYSIFGTNPSTGSVDTPLFYPEGSMPFNQFIGTLANQNGRVTEYSYAPGAAAANGNRVSVRNTNGHSNKFVATVSELGAPGMPGGVVFELGGHTYADPDQNETDSTLSRLNGQRMLLNAVFVPVTRPMECGLQQAEVVGYKSVRRFNTRNGGPPLIAGDTLEWTIDYVNFSAVDVTNFNIRDQIGVIDGTNHGNLTFVAGSNQVTILSGGATATRNPAFDGVGNDATSDLLANGAFLPVGGRIQVKVRTTINLLGSNNQPLPDGTILWNQTVGTGAQILTPVKSDAIDWTNTTIFGIDSPTPDSFLQFQNVGILDPTIARIKGPTAADASIEGEVRSKAGAPIVNAMVTVTNAANGQSKAVRTNAMGRFQVSDLELNDLYVITAQHRQFSFTDGPITFQLSDNVTGLAIIGTPVQVKGGAAAPEVAPTKVKARL